MTFLIRQLYYPYRLWKPKTTKEVVPIFLSISDNIFSFYVYRFAEESHYNSIELLSHKKYQIGTTDIELEDIVKTLNSTATILPEPIGIPFPQSDSFGRIDRFADATICCTTCAFSGGYYNQSRL